MARFCYDRQALSRLNDEHSLYASKGASRGSEGPQFRGTDGADVSASCDCSEHIMGKVSGKPECTRLAFKEVNEDCPDPLKGCSLKSCLDPSVMDHCDLSCLERFDSRWWDQ